MCIDSSNILYIHIGLDYRDVIMKTSRGNVNDGDGTYFTNIIFYLNLQIRLRFRINSINIVGVDTTQEARFSSNFSKNGLLSKVMRGERNKQHVVFILKPK